MTDSGQPRRHAPEARRSAFDLDLASEHDGRVRRAALRLVGRTIQRVAGLDALARIYSSAPEDCSGLDFVDCMLDRFGVRVEVDARDLERIPAKGPVFVVANHPFGGIEGLVLAKLLGQRRRDFKIFANFLLHRIPELSDLFLFVDPFQGGDSVRSNLMPLRTATRWLRDGGALAAFPAGEVSHLDLRNRRVADPPWNPMIAGLVRKARCPVVPLFFEGRNRAVFQALGLVHPRVRTALLPREMLARSGQPIEARIGTPVGYRELADFAGDEETVAYLRSRTYILSQRSPVRFHETHPVQPRATPRHAQPVIAPVPVPRLVDEIERLPDDQLLVDAGDQVVYVASAPQIPAIIREIGRLRELTFREVGEGTGREVDLDVFDPTYLHLFIWARDAKEIVGAYRLGLSDVVTRERGLAGLYTSTLFRYKPRLFETMGPSLEMGRSFIRPEYQKSYAGMVLLWKGIGEFVKRNPRYATLFGPVSISADYRSASQRLIVAFLEQNRYVHEWARWVKPLCPTPADRSGGYRPSPSHLRNLDEVSTFISEIEADQKGVPILLKQYLKLGGRLLGFNVDPEFSNVLDVLIMVDLRRTAPNILGRYMGREGAAAFFAAHAEPRTDREPRAS